MHRALALLSSLMLAIPLSGCLSMVASRAPDSGPNPDADVPGYGAVMGAAFQLAGEGHLKEDQTRYTEYMRAGLIDKAAGYVAKDLQPEFRELARSFREVRVSGVSVDHYEFARSEATFVIRYRAYTLSAPWEKEYAVTQHWVADPRAQRWQIRPDVEELRRIAEGMPASAR